MVNSKFTTYRDAFLFGLILGLGLHIQSFDLSTEQSEAAFLVAKLVAKLVTKKETHIEAGMEPERRGDRADPLSDNQGNRPHYDTMTIKNLKCTHKRTGATR